MNELKPVDWLMMTILTIVVAWSMSLAGCGTAQDALNNAPTTLEADPKTGEVTVKGDKGDTGPQGPAGKDGKDGTNGKDGAEGPQGPAGATGPKGDSGATGKDGDPLQGIWKDSVTGRLWLQVNSKMAFQAAGVACGTWKIPTAAILLPALQHGLTRLLPVPTPAALERAWTSDADPSGDAYARTMVIMDPTIETYGGIGGFLATNTYRVYCTKD